MKLFGHPDSGHAFKVKFFLEHAAVVHDYEFVDINQPRKRRQKEFRDNTRFGEVPLLRDDDRFVPQSNAILLHLADKLGRHGSENATMLDEVRVWLAWEANRIGMSLPQIRSFHRFPDHGIATATLDWLNARYRYDVNVLDTAFADGRDWIIGTDEPTIADFSLCGYLVHASEARVEVPAHVAGWLDRLRSLPRWQPPYEMLAQGKAVS